jgi:hypothetical protein
MVAPSPQSGRSAFTEPTELRATINGRVGSRHRLSPPGLGMYVLGQQCSEVERPKETAPRLTDCDAVAKIAIC